ncbi:sodium/solute symporter [Victivallis vadensis]|uniref:sodium:solute symporter family transporter n=1 Tax=Victivallis vadensis TaxID=172901 RepID=UPI00266D096E|nr:sodium/solute symporter [Victivallis vadensis]
MFRIADLAAIMIYFAAMALMGIYFARKNRSTEDYFLGKRAFPGWAIGLSMLGTSISSVTFLALPAAAYALDMRQFVPLGPVVAAVLACWIFIPFFRRGRTISAFEYLEARYGTVVRCYAAGSFVVLQFIRLATILYLVALPVAAMTGWNIFLIVLVTGVVVALYTTFGGFEAVVWTDVVQTVILLGGALLCFAIIIGKLPGGFGQILSVGMEYHKFSFGPMSFVLNERTFWAVLLLGIVSSVTEYSSNQNVIQRYIAAKSTREARKATLLCVGMSVVTWGSFFFLGICLFVFYKVTGGETVKELASDQILPFFIFSQTPPFIAGSIVAACFAAAMSSLSSSINSIATVATVDFYRRFGRDGDDRRELRFAKRLSMLVSAWMIGGAVLIHYIPKESINDLTIVLGSLLGGGLLSIYMLGFFTVRVGEKALLAGLAVALLVNFAMLLHEFGVIELPVHSYWATILVNAALAVVAWPLSLLWPNRKPTDGLTVWDRQAGGALKRSGKVQ